MNVLSSFVKTICATKIWLISLQSVAFCRYVILCFLVDDLSPPEVKKRVCVAIHSRFSLYLRKGNKKIKTDVAASSSNSAEGNGVGVINHRVVMGKELVL